MGAEVFELNQHVFFNGQFQTFGRVRELRVVFFHNSTRRLRMLEVRDNGGKRSEAFEVEPVLETIGMKLARTPGRALAALVLRRLYMRLRRLGFKERSESALHPTRRLAIDTGWSIADGSRSISCDTSPDRTPTTTSKQFTLN